MKFNQNVFTKHGHYEVDTTMTSVFVYSMGKCVGSASVRKAEDFDFDTLFRLALHKSGSTIQVA